MAKTEDDYQTEPELIDGHPWTDVLQDSLEICADKWDLRLGEELRLAMVGYVVGATGRNGEEYVIKLRDPGVMYRREITALQLFDGNGAARLIDYEPSRGASLIERVSPGTEMGDCVPEIDPNEVVLSVMQHLYDPKHVKVREEKSAIEALPTSAWQCRSWAEGLRTYEGWCPIERPRRLEAATRLEEYADFPAPSQVVHGDFNISNVLRSGENDWKAIDPKGFWAPVAFDIAWWLRDPPAGQDIDVPAILRRRRDMLCEAFELDRQVILEWAKSLAVVITVARSAVEIYWDAKRLALLSEAIDTL